MATDASSNGGGGQGLQLVVAQRLHTACARELRRQHARQRDAALLVECTALMEEEEQQRQQRQQKEAAAAAAAAPARVVEPPVPPAAVAGGSGLCLRIPHRPRRAAAAAAAVAIAAGSKRKRSVAELERWQQLDADDGDGDEKQQQQPVVVDAEVHADGGGDGGDEAVVDADTHELWAARNPPSAVAVQSVTESMRQLLQRADVQLKLERNGFVAVDTRAVSGAAMAMAAQAVAKRQRTGLLMHTYLERPWTTVNDADTRRTTVPRAAYHRATRALSELTSGWSHVRVLDAFRRAMSGRPVKGWPERMVYVMGEAARSYGITDDQWKAVDARGASIVDFGASFPAAAAYGVSVPTLFVSNAVTYFAAHLEVGAFGSSVQHVSGAPKVIFVVPPQQRDAFGAYVRQLVGQCGFDGEDVDWLHLYCAVPDAALRQRFSIGVACVDGDACGTVLLAPGAWHWGVALGAGTTASINTPVPLRATAVGISDVAARAVAAGNTALYVMVAHLWRPFVDAYVAQPHYRAALTLPSDMPTPRAFERRRRAFDAAVVAAAL